MYTSVLYIIIGVLVIFALLLVLIIQGLKSKRHALMLDKMSREMDDVDYAPFPQGDDMDDMGQPMNENERMFIPSNMKK